MDYKYREWWNKLSEEEQERILKTVYIMQEQGIWEEVDDE